MTKDATVGPNKPAAADLSADAHPRQTYATYTLTTFKLHKYWMDKSTRTSTGLFYMPTTHEQFQDGIITIAL